MIDKNNSKNFELEYKKGNNALLLGNGINNLMPDFRWDLLLRKLDGKINLDEKPYTLAFEEIVLKKLAGTNNNKSYKEILKGIKDTIAEHCSKIEPDGYHKKIRSLNISTFLTTNYDYAIEKTIDENFDIAKVKRTTKDFKYSLNRYHIVNNKKVWHIHGEIDNGYKRDNINQYASASIMIGHEHYGDYYRRIHQYLRPFSTDEKTKDKYINNPNWVKLFFTHNLHIVGLSLDSSEFHLWWILAYRARLKENYRNIENNIFYHCASYDMLSAKQKAKIDLLESFGVKIKDKKIEETSDKKYSLYWDEFFKTINSIIKNNE
jgi:hypothetical protein